MRGHAARAVKRPAKPQPKGQMFLAGGTSLDAATSEVALAGVNWEVGAVSNKTPVATKTLKTPSFILLLMNDNIELCLFNNLEYLE